MPKYDEQIPVPIPLPETGARDYGPLQVATVAVVCAAIIAGALGLLLDRPLDELWRWLVIGALLPLCIVLIATIGRLIVFASNLATWKVEQKTGIDFTGDGIAGDPSVIAINPRQGIAQAKRDQARDYKRRFNSFIRGCEGTGTAWRAWQNQMTRDQWEDWRDKLIGSGFAGWINERDQRAGWKLLMSPEEIIQQMWRE